VQRHKPYEESKEYMLRLRSDNPMYILTSVKHGGGSVMDWAENLLT